MYHPRAHFIRCPPRGCVSGYRRLGATAMKRLAAFLVLLIPAFAAPAAPPPDCQDMCLQEGHAWSYCTKLCGRKTPGVPGVTPVPAPAYPGMVPAPAPAYPGMTPRAPLTKPGLPPNPLLNQPGLPRNPAFDDVERSIQPEPRVPANTDRKCLRDCQRQGYEYGLCLRQCSY